MQNYFLFNYIHTFTLLIAIKFLLYNIYLIDILISYRIIPNWYFSPIYNKHILLNFLIFDPSLLTSHFWITFANLKIQESMKKLYVALETVQDLFSKYEPNFLQLC